MSLWVGVFFNRFEVDTLNLKVSKLGSNTKPHALSDPLSDTMP